jgi:hypothetical protein
MSEVFVIRNQLGQYWGRKKRWVDGRKPRKVLTFKHRDEGLNQLVELSARDVDLRGDVVAVQVNERDIPVVEASEHLIKDEDELLQADGPDTAGSGGVEGEEPPATA